MSEDDLENEWDFWDEADATSVGYSSELDRDIIDAARAIIAKTFSDDFAKQRGWPQAYAELLYSLLCSYKLKWFTYGTSPRSAFLDYPAKPEDIINKLEDWYRRKWEQPSP